VRTEGKGNSTRLAGPRPLFRGVHDKVRQTVQFAVQRLSVISPAVGNGSGIAGWISLKFGAEQLNITHTAA
jgi:hypothetical protein